MYKKANYVTLYLLLDDGGNNNGGEMDSEHERQKRNAGQMDNGPNNNGKIIVRDFVDIILNRKL